MPACGEIMTDIRDALRGTGAFEAVTIGASPDAARWPRAEITLVSLDQAPADDAPATRWFTLRAKVSVLVRSGTEPSALERALELAQAAQEALLADPFRGQRCRDLPVGQATELGPVSLQPHLKLPCQAAGFEVRCRYEVQESP